MKCHALSFQILAFAILLTPQSQGATHCHHLSNFCDTILLDTVSNSVYGNWDWECIGDWTNTSIMGNIKTGAPELAARVYDPEFSYLAFYVSQFSFRSGKIFDLYSSSGIDGGILTETVNEPYTVTEGACSGRDINRNKPRLLATFFQEKRQSASRSQNTTHCIHFTNFCDSVEFATSGALAYGVWDWTCEGEWTQNPVIGNATVGPELTTRPKQANGFAFTYTAHLSFKPGKLVDLYESDGIESGLLAVWKNQPFTVTNGACSPRDVAIKKPRMIEP